MNPPLTAADFPPRLFITGTDTGIGKTLVAAVLLSGLGGCYWKPVQSGLDEITDTDWIRDKTGLGAGHFLPETWRLPRPASPHLAAAEAGVTIDLKQLAVPEIPGGQTLLIEGAGGVLVPLNDRQFMSDLIRQLQAPVLVVAPDRLGMINHTLLTMEHLRGCGIEIFGVVLNGEANDENKQAVETYGRVPVLARIDTLAEVTPTNLAAQFTHFAFPLETARKGTP